MLGKPKWRFWAAAAAQKETKNWFLSWSERSETQRKTTIHCSSELEQPAAYAADGEVCSSAARSRQRATDRTERGSDTLVLRTKVIV